MNEYTIKGKLKDKKWFLEKGWVEHHKYIEDIPTGFNIYFSELDSELTLKEITDYVFRLELEDENGTQYKREWFAEMEEMEEPIH